MKNFLKLFFTGSISILLNTGTLFAQDVNKIIIALDGSGDYNSIQAAIDAAKSFPDQRVTIFFKNGIYKEKVVLLKAPPTLSLVRLQLYLMIALFTARGIPTL